jgi:Centrosomal spindle body, CEP44
MSSAAGSSTTPVLGSTGDLQGNINRLVDCLRGIAYPLPVPAKKLREGDTNVLLPMLNYCLLDYSRHVSAMLHEKVSLVLLRFKDVSQVWRPQARPTMLHLDPFAFRLQGFRFFGKDDRSFVEDVFRLLKETWGVSASQLHINATQFLAPRGFVERKLLLVVEVMKRCMRIHSEAERAHLASKAVFPYTR